MEKSFFTSKKKINQDQLDELIFLGDKSIRVEQKISRIYPHENLFSHIVGQIDDDNNGISGIEKSFDLELKTNDLIPKKIKNILELNITNNEMITKELINKSGDKFEKNQ